MSSDINNRIALRIAYFTGASCGVCASAATCHYEWARCFRASILYAVRLKEDSLSPTLASTNAHATVLCLLL